jgi:isopenicillin N synthase-like dioxygenase
MESISEQQVPATGFSIPSVDISEYLKSPNSDRSKDIVKQIRHACITSGFFQITGHGIDRDLQDQVFNCAQKFFDLPIDEKQKLRSSQGRGFELIGSQTLEPGMKADMKEVSLRNLNSTTVSAYREYKF